MPICRSCSETALFVPSGCVMQGQGLLKGTVLNLKFMLKKFLAEKQQGVWVGTASGRNLLLPELILCALVICIQSANM